MCVCVCPPLPPLVVFSPSLLFFTLRLFSFHSFKFLIFYFAFFLVLGSSVLYFFSSFHPSPVTLFSHTHTQTHTHTPPPCRSRLSWGQMLGCYTPPGLTVSGLDAGEQPSGLQSSWLPQCWAPKAPRRHLYPVAFLLVTSHLLVLWLILSLVILLAKYQ